MKINSLKYQLNMEMNGAWAPMNKTSETQWQQNRQKSKLIQ